MKKRRIVNDLPNNTEELKERQEELLAVANKNLRDKVDWVIEWYKHDTSNSLMSRWELGAEVLEILNDKENNGAKLFGSKAFSTIAVFSGEAEGSLRICAAMADIYTKAQMKEISEMLMADGVTPLSYSHIRNVISITNAEERQRAINMALENCWNSDQLSKYVQRMRGTKTNNANGRPVAKPKGVTAVIGQQLQFADDFEKRNIKVWRDPDSSITGQLNKIPPAQYTEQIADDLGRLIHKLTQMKTAIDPLIEEATAKFTEVRAALDKKYAEGLTLASQLKDNQPSTEKVEIRKTVSV